MAEIARLTNSIAGLYTWLATAWNKEIMALELESVGIIQSNV